MHATDKTFDLPKGRVLVLDRALPPNVEALVVLVQPELERRRSPLVSIPPFRAGIFKALGLSIR
jgi:hypothetical protein